MALERSSEPAWLGLDLGTQSVRAMIDLINDRRPDQVFEALGIPGEILPPVVRAGTFLGVVGAEAARTSRIPLGTPVVAESLARIREVIDPRPDRTEIFARPYLRLVDELVRRGWLTSTVAQHGPSEGRRVTHLFLVRHGQTVWHAENRYAGATEVELDPTGREQAERLGVWAAQAKLTAIWCSPLSRASQTGTPAARATGLDLRIDKCLRELDFGQVEGKTMAEAEQFFPAGIRDFKTDPVAHPMPGGEDPRQAASRFVSALRDVTALCPNGRVLVVAHNTIIRLALCSLLGIPLARYRTVFPSVRNVALTEIRLENESAALLQYNTPLSVPAVDT